MRDRHKRSDRAAIQFFLFNAFAYNGEDRNARIVELWLLYFARKKICCSCNVRILLRSRFLGRNHFFTFGAFSNIQYSITNYTKHILDSVSKFFISSRCSQLREEEFAEQVNWIKLNERSIRLRTINSPEEGRSKWRRGKTAELIKPNRKPNASRPRVKSPRTCFLEIYFCSHSRFHRFAFARGSYPREIRSEAKLPPLWSFVFSPLTFLLGRRFRPAVHTRRSRAVSSPISLFPPVPSPALLLHLRASILYFDR